jgi:hypothetical protein
VVTPAEMALQVRLHLRTRQTLAAYANELAPRTASSPVCRRLLEAARAMLPSRLRPLRKPGRTYATASEPRSLVHLE